MMVMIIIGIQFDLIRFLSTLYHWTINTTEQVIETDKPEQPLNQNALRLIVIDWDSIYFRWNQKKEKKINRFFDLKTLNRKKIKKRTSSESSNVDDDDDVDGDNYSSIDYNTTISSLISSCSGVDSFEFSSINFRSLCRWDEERWKKW